MAGSPKHPTVSRIFCWRVLCLLAILFMAILAAEHLAKQGGVLAGLCQFGAGWSCEETLAHPAAVFLALPMPLWAIAFYSLLLFVGPDTWRHQRRFRLAGLMVAALILASLFFLVIMERDFSKLCPLCLATHLCHFLLLLTFLFAGRDAPVIPAAAATAPRRLPLSLPLALLLLSYMVIAWRQEVRQADDRYRYLTSADLLADVLHGDFARFFPARPEQRIWGEEKAPFQLVIIGSLSCSHCRELLRAVQTLPAEADPRRGTAIFFMSYPLSPLCNHHLRTDQGHDEGGEQCLLAAKTIEAQRHGDFWPWFAEVDRAPGRMLRRLRSLPASEASGRDRTLGRQIDTLAAIPVTGIPTLLWQGQKLPAAFSGLPLARLISRLIDMEERSTDHEGETDCGC